MEPKDTQLLVTDRPGPAVADPLVSVVIPSHNYGRFVTEAVESVLAQTYKNLEVVVVDDGSTDDTRQRLEPYRDRIRYLYQDNQGVSAARNAGIRAARGELVAFLDSDDAWHPRKLEVQVAYLAGHPEVCLVAADPVPDLRPGWPALDSPARCAAQPVTLDDLIVRPCFGPSVVLARKSCFDAVGFFDTGLSHAEDRDMWIRIASRFLVVNLRAPLWWYRVHNAAASMAAERMERGELKVLRKAFADIGPLRGRWLLRRKSFGLAAASAAYVYGLTGLQRRALGRILWSLVLWPWPYRRGDFPVAFARLKMLAAILLRLLRLRPAGRQPQAP